jgi:acyl carrier protein
MAAARSAHSARSVMPDAVAEKVVSIVASVKHIPVEKVTVESSLANLGFDSLDTITLLFELESGFQISISDEQARSIRTVKEIIEGIHKLLENPPPAVDPSPAKLPAAE